MDGTTAGTLPTPQPASQDGSFFIDHSAAPVQQAVTPQPPQPQYSQLTPVYAPTPTNTIADIPQPLVKGIEFVKSPTLPPPVATTPPLVTSPSLTPPTAMAAPQAAPPAVAPTAPPVMQPVQPIVEQAMPLPMPPALNEAPGVYGQETPPQPVIEPVEFPNANDYVIQKIENTNIEQLVGAIPPTVTAVAEPAPVTSTPQADLSYYFQNIAPQAESVISPVAVRQGWLNRLGKKRIIIVLAVIGGILVLSGGGYAIYTNVTANRTTQAPTTTAQTPAPAVTQPDFVQPSTTATTQTPDTTSTATTTTPTPTTAPTTATTPTSPTPAVTTTPVVVAPASPTTTAPAQPVVSNTGLEW